MKKFVGRVVAPGEVRHVEALVSHGGLNTLASFQGALQFGDKKVKCGDQSNPDLYGKEMAGKALCIPQTIGSTTGGLVLYCACSMRRQPSCMLFSKPIDSLAGAGVILADVWLDGGAQMPVIDSLGDEFLETVKTGDKITVESDGTVIIE
ncbi:MAG: DUF126 domain-containing protein [Clostridia bacterium]|nr:DUF126 domain-containing protein [Clostridia bacterium]